MLIAQLFLRHRSAPYTISYIPCCNHGKLAKMATQVLLIDSHRLLLLGKTLNSMEIEVIWLRQLRHQWGTNSLLICLSFLFHENITSRGLSIIDLIKFSLTGFLLYTLTSVTVPLCH